jgi:hypothetical protein
VGDDENGGAEPGVKVVNQREDLRAGLAVEVAGRLVGQHDGGIDRQGPGDGYPLPLAAGEFFGQMFETLAQSDQLD